MIKDALLILSGTVAGAMIAIGTMSLTSQDVIVTDGVTVSADMPVGYEYKYNHMEYRQDDGDLVLEIHYTKRGIE